MNTDSALLAVEYSLSEAVGRRLLGHVSITATQTVGLKGAAYLRKKARGLNKTARGFPVLLITDQDRASQCAPSLVQTWLGEPAESALLFRVAVFEIESWVMADRSNFARFLRVRVASIPDRTDDVINPKEKVVSLANTSSVSAIRRDLTPSKGSTAKVGPAYNARLSEFVRDVWDPDRAAIVSPSLRRALNALITFRT